MTITATIEHKAPIRIYVKEQRRKRRPRKPFISASARRLYTGPSRYTQLLEQNEALYAHSRRLADWIQLLSHELRKPLTTISGGLELVLACEPHLSPTVHDTLAIVRAQSLRLGHLVAMILDESALSTGQPRLRLGAVALPAILEAVLREQPPSRRADCAIPEGFPAVWADADALGHVLAQLLDHAFKYAHGPVAIAADIEIEDDEIEENEDGRAAVTITAHLPAPDGADDELAEAERRHLFDPKRIADMPSLVVSNALVEAMGGRIQLDDGRWTVDHSLSPIVIRLTLPLADLMVSLPVE